MNESERTHAVPYNDQRQPFYLTTVMDNEDTNTHKDNEVLSPTAKPSSYVYFITNLTTNLLTVTGTQHFTLPSPHALTARLTHNVQKVNAVMKNMVLSLDITN